ncbi:MAG: hypothetical protein J6U36_07755 [Oscillospiraceae bacterium]|nr:hypothetical protein [Oscillospiraceae bacterium]MBP1568517.1 hypothetical protein [Oscillospiraceae bacterium]MBP1592052.1 hypothetical protein [Oscillospiraceae bacterium]
MKNKSKYMSAALAAFVFAVSLAGCEKGNTGASEPEVTNVQTETEASSEVTAAVSETTAETTGITTTVSETVTSAEQTTEQTTVTTEITTEETTPAPETEAAEPETEEAEQTLSYAEEANRALIGKWTLRSYVNMTYIGYEFHEDGTWEALPVPPIAENDPEYAASMPKGTWQGTNGGRDYYAYAMYDENGDLYYGIQVYIDDTGYETLERGDGMCFYNGKEHTPEE